MLFRHPHRFIQNPYILIVVALFLYGTLGNAQAQERLNRDQETAISNIPVTERVYKGYEPKGVRVGAFFLHPKLELEEEYNTNIFATATGEQDDFLTRAKPSLELQSNWSRHSLTLEAEGEFVRHASLDDEDHNNYDAQAVLALEVTKLLTATASANYRQDILSRGGVDSINFTEKPIGFRVYEGNMGLLYAPGRLNLDLIGSFRRYRYDNGTNSTTNAVVVQEDQDRDEFGLTSKLAYSFSPDYATFIKAGVSRRKYEKRDFRAGGFTGIKRDSTGFLLLAGLQVDLSSLLVGDFAVGYEQDSFDNDTLKSAGAFAIEANFTWNITPMTTLTGQLTRSVENSTNLNSSFTETEAGLALDHELQRNFIVGLRANRVVRDFSANGREDKTSDGGVTAKYKLNENFYIGGDALMRVRNSTDNNFEFDQGIFILRLESQL